MSSRRTPGRAIGLVLICAVAATIGTRGASPRFFPDDPLQVDDDRALDASKVTPIEGSNAFDFAENTFGHPGDRTAIRAVNVNSIDEVPDSSWFVNRIGRHAMSGEEIARGPNQGDPAGISG